MTKLPSTDRVRVLLIEDDLDDYILTRDLLADMPGRPYELDRVPDYGSGLEMLRQEKHAICLLDYRLGARNGLELLKEIRADGFHPAMIMLTGQMDRELDLAAMEAGATDFLEKSSLTVPVLERALRYALQQKWNEDLLEERVAERTAELHASEERMRQVALDLEKADHRKDEFMAMLAHELRNPLAPLRSAVDVLQMNSEDAEQVRTVAGMLERQVRQMVHLVDDLLDVSRITRGKIELRLQRVDLATVVTQVVEAFNAQLTQMGHQLKVDQPGGPISMEGDPVRLTQVLGNLLSNAVKFTPEGGRIELNISKESGSAVIRVKDNGMGIAPENIPSIFEMFVQVDASLERPTSGLGLGLTLVKKLVELHSGSVEVHSGGKGQGTEFTLRLPILQQEQHPSALPNAKPRTEVVGRRILIVDDNVDAATMLSLMLNRMGNETHTASDGRAGVAAAEALRPEIIVMDIGLPQMNGYDACSHIRKQPWGRDIRIIALTGWGQAEDRQKSKDAGFNAHLVKPVDIEELKVLLV